jgi:hypothetical protein
MDTSNPLVLIPSIGHIPRMKAHLILMANNYYPWRMVVDNDQQASNATKAGVPPSNLEITGDPPSSVPQMDRIAWKREWMERRLASLNRWYVSLDDNVTGWTYLPKPFYDQPWINFNEDVSWSGKTWRQLYETEMPFGCVVEIWKEMIADCEKAGTWYGGFAIENNYFYRSHKFQTLGYVRTSNAVIKNVGLPFYYWPGAMLEDFIRSVNVAVRTGSVLINRFVKVQKKFFEPGGIGSFEARRPNLVKCCEELQRRFPSLLRPVKGQDYSLTFALRGKSFEAWRRERGFL